LGSYNTDGLKAVLILASSYNSNGMGLAHKKDWRQYAEKENLSLLSVHLKSTPTGNSYTDASGGSGAALLKAVDAFPYDKYPESIKVASWHIDSEFASS
jgi:hypothetical protein